jgi:hypothetical protein
MPRDDHLAACTAIHRLLHDVAGTAPEYDAALNRWHHDNGCPYQRPADRRLYKLTDDERHTQLHALATIEHGQRWATSSLDAFHRVHGCDRTTADGRTD